MSESQLIIDPGSLPVGPTDRQSASFWGVLCLIATEGSLFAYLLFSYFYFDVQLPHSWRVEAPDFRFAVPETVLMAAATLGVWLAEFSIARGRRALTMAGLGTGLVFGLGFLAAQIWEWTSKTFTVTSGPYGSVFFTITGAHVLHALVGVVALGFVLLWTALGWVDRVRSASVTNTALYWYFVAVLWLVIFVTLDITPYLW